MTLGLGLWYQKTRKKSRLSPGCKRLLALFTKVADERDKLRRDLGYALDTVEALEAQNAEYNFHLTQAQAHLVERQKNNQQWTAADSQRPIVEVTTEVAWIEDTWLCSLSNADLLGEAEMHWKKGYPHWTSSTSSCPCTLISISRTILNTAFSLQRGVQQVGSVRGRRLKNRRRHRIAYYRQARELGGIARFIRGKNLMALKPWDSAYWFFSRAPHTPGYHVKAQQLQAMENPMRGGVFRSGPELPKVNFALGTTGIPTTPPSTLVPESWVSPQSEGEILLPLAVVPQELFRPSLKCLEGKS
ncbi:hypothetical protein VTN00DRAFT_3864 [Thermoascus crustaceus]|uniref:uncharacterized protein n=1 Tax=Thermoascus crustaceus TaxID=5088 RepID=UPI0037436DEA